MKYHFKVNNYTWACVVLRLSGFGSANLIFICGQLLLCANGACEGVVARVSVVYTGIE